MAFSAVALEERTKQFGVRAILAAREHQAARDLWEAFRQLSRAATSVGANHRAMSRARSAKEFEAKLQIVYEEVDETCYWLEVIEATAPASETLNTLHTEARELRAIFAKARATTRAKLSQGAPR